jgi:hypothetical protein
MNTRSQEGNGTDSLLILGTVACLLGLPGVTGAIALLILQRRIIPETWRVVSWLLVGLATLGGILGYVFLANPWRLFPPILDAVEGRQWLPALLALKSQWLASLWLAPAIRVLMQVFHTESPEQQVLHQANAEQARAMVASRRAAHRIGHQDVPEVLQGHPVVGASVTGDLPAWVQGPWMTIPIGELRKPCVVVGESRAGKTTTLLRLAYLVVKVLGWHVIYIDCKGDEDLAVDFTASMLAAGLNQEDIRVFPYATYNAWKGDGAAIFNKLIGILRTPTTVSAGAEYYRDLLKLLLDLAIKARPEPPRSSQQLLSRMRLSTLEALYNGKPEAADVEDMSKEAATGSRSRYRAFFGALNGKLDGHWSFEDAKASYILLEGLGMREEAMSLGRFYVEEIAHYCTKRKPREEQVLCIIDDAGALELGRETAGLAERLAGYGCYLYLSGQSFESLGPYAKQIVGATTTRILHRASDPEQITSRAGTRNQIQTSAQVRNEQGATGATTYQSREAPNVHPDTIKRLATGEAVIIAHGHGHRVRVAQILPDSEHVEAAQELLATMQQLYDPKTVQDIVGVKEEKTISSTSSGDGDGEPQRLD